MFLAFQCKNFRSIRESQRFSLIAAKTRRPEHDHTLLETPIAELKAVRCAGIYGANASGKSNVLKALERFSRIVSLSQRRWDPTAGVPDRYPFLLDEHSSSENTEFQLDFIWNSRIYNYGFRFTDACFEHEWLTDTTGKDRRIFRRSTEDGTVSVEFPGRNIQDSTDQNKRLEIARLQTRDNSLFLSAAAQNNHDFLSQIYKWITDRFDVVKASSNVFHTSTLTSGTSRAKKDRIVKLLRSADFGIVDFRVSEVEYDESTKRVFAAMSKALEESDPSASPDITRFPTSREDITILHRGADGKSYPLPSANESSGTIAYFNLLGPVLTQLDEGGVLLIDELEASLHPLLARQIIRMFNDPQTNPKGAQLVFSTHDTSLFDLGSLRRDQFWFTEKNAQGATELTPLSEYKVRKGTDVASAYLEGRFGGTPIIASSLVASALSEDVESSEGSDGHQQI